MPAALINSNSSPTPAATIAIVSRCGIFAPMLTSELTPADPSVFIRTIRQFPALGFQVRDCGPVPLALALQNVCAPGGELGAPPL